MSTKHDTPQNNHEHIIREILVARGYTDTATRQAFLDPKYDDYKHDPFLLPDMDKAVNRLVQAHKKAEKIVIYGDYDIDGLTATSVLLEAFASFGFTASAFIPNRFVDGYGLSKKAIETLIEQGAQLIVTVDCGSLSFEEIKRAKELGVDVIVTDHHSVADTMPEAVAVVNPKRLLAEHPELYHATSLTRMLPSMRESSKATLSADRISEKHTPSDVYPFVDLAGVGVAFKLVQALQTKLDGLEPGQEKWLLDLVALGTVCDVVQLRDENRANVRWGLEVMRKTRRPGLRALIAVARIKPSDLEARSLGFGLGPRLNASGRLETAQLSLDLLTATDSSVALKIAEQLETMNLARRSDQDRIFQHAIEKYQERINDPVLIVSDPSWSHGIIGIVAAKLLERYHKPTFVLQELPDGTAKGSARSFGDFSAVDAIRATETHLIKGGGHKLAAGIALKASAIDPWRAAMTSYYKTLKLGDQIRYLMPNADVTLEGFALFQESLIRDIAKLEPYGNGNPSPIFKVEPVEIIGRRTMGDRGQHVKYTLADTQNKTFQVIAFNKADEFTASIGDSVAIWVELTINEWQGRRSIEGRLLRMELVR
ncbi:MAG: DHH family phosphoesterase [Candidatus Saccharimonadales bacterium]